MRFRNDENNLTEMKTIVATTPANYHDAKKLIGMYQAWLGIDLEFQGYSAEIESLSEVYGTPSGAMILTYLDKQPVGCVGLRKLSEGVCELKRMFVIRNERGKGVGNHLLENFMRTAEIMNYKTVRLDTLRRLEAALHIYQKAGFRVIDAYRYNPEPEVVFMELDINTWHRRQEYFKSAQ